MINRKHQNRFIGLLFFFFNSLGLPAPVTYTSLISLVRLKEVVGRYTTVLIAIAAICVGYGVIHYFQGAVVKDLILSQGFYLLLIFSGFVAYDFLRFRDGEYGKLFEWLSVVAIIVFAVGLVLLFTPFSELLWAKHKFIADGGAQVLRFKAFSHEASHLALCLSPIFLYLFWKLVSYPSVKKLSYLLAVTVPITLTMSFGFAAAWGISTLVTLLLVLLTYREFKRILIIPMVLVSIATIGVNTFENPISNRIDKILEGKDTSVNGRTYEAFILAHQCAEKKNVWFGIGMGQIKYVGEEVIRPYYKGLDPTGYQKESMPVMRLPNSMAETLATYGYTGVFLKLIFIIVCFFRFKVYDNYFNLSIFAFIFFYQLMGTFILSSTEVIIWAIAFAKVFPELKVGKQMDQGLKQTV